MYLLCILFITYLLIVFVLSCIHVMYFFMIEKSFTKHVCAWEQAGPRYKVLSKFQ